MPDALPRPAWALPPEPPAPGGMRRSLFAAAALTLVIVPSAVVGTSDAESSVLATALSVAGLAGLTGAAALAVQARATADPWLRRAAVGFAVVPVLVLVRALSGADVGSLLGREGSDLRVRGIELALAVVATVAALLWIRRAPAGSRHGHGWVTTALALAALASTGRALVEQRSGATWWAALAATDLGIVVPALGLALVTCRRYRRQLRRWRHLQARVRAARASSPLLPGLSVSPEEQDDLPGRGEIDRVLASGQIGIALQPVVGLVGTAVLGWEALSRFGGRVPPDRWFLAARRHGLAVELELLALRCALVHVTTLPEGAFLAVNLSPPALADPTVLAELRTHDLSRLVLEVTEHEAVRDYAAARGELAALRELGARIAVDDTGAGFASLRHVLLLQPEVVKLDRTLTVGVDHDERQRALVAALVELCEEVGVLVIAEGVENQEQLVTLQSLRVQAAQGFHLGVPALQPLVADQG